MIFHKIAGTGNDFILIDNRQSVGSPLNQVNDLTDWIIRLCHRQKGIGADGVLILEDPQAVTKADIRMKIINADGSEAEMCGNGLRCVVYYANQFKIASSPMKVETLAGILSGEVLSDTLVRVQLPNPSDWRDSLSFEGNGSTLEGALVNTGVPHAVLFVDNIEKVEVEELGRFIRYHDQFAPQGANVNFVQPSGTNQIKVRTYERGVEAETLACGTGVTASALISVQRNRVAAPVNIQTWGGDQLTVNFKQNNKTISDVSLEGPVQMVFTGEIENV